MIGCWLVRHGMDCDQALATIAALRRETAYGDRPSPESDEQRDMVRAWRELSRSASRERREGTLLE